MIRVLLINFIVQCFIDKLVKYSNYDESKEDMQMGARMCLSAIVDTIEEKENGWIGKSSTSIASWRS